MSDDSSFDEEIKRDFLDEVTGLLDQCEESYLKLEDPSCRSDELGKIFRAVHSMKGSGASVGFIELASFAHVVEDFLSILRSKPHLVDVYVISVLLKSGDEFKKCICKLKSKDSEPWDIEKFKKQVKELTDQLIQNESESSSELPPKPFQDQVSMAIGDIIKIDDQGIEEERESNNKKQDGAIEKSTAASAASKVTASIKVDAERIESVLNIAGELLVLKSQLDNHCKSYANDVRLRYLLSLVDKSISEMHDKTLSMRMMPLKNLFLKTQRVIRDLSLKLGKPVDFQMSGENTEIDRTMVDLLGDPLMHIVRNSLDHGIEGSDVRKNRNKPEKGTIHLSAFQTGGRVVVKIDDDGGGINRDKIITRAKEKALLHETVDSTSLTDKQVFDFIFAPGFSTAEKITDVSGRGVGMDVVKTNIEKIKGTIDIETKEGHGTSLIISIPLTTAITEGMIFRIDSEFYVFPMDCIQQLIKIETAAIVRMHSGQEIIKYRNNIYSYFRLEDHFKDELLDIKQRHNMTENESIRMVLIATGKQVVAIRVDDVLGQFEAVLKPLGDSYQKMDGISGAAVLGNGRLALVLDPLGLERVFAANIEACKSKEGKVTGNEEVAA